MPLSRKPTGVPWLALVTKIVFWHCVRTDAHAFNVLPHTAKHQKDNHYITSSFKVTGKKQCLQCKKGLFFLAHDQRNSLKIARAIKIILSSIM